MVLPEQGHVLGQRGHRPPPARRRASPARVAARAVCFVAVLLLAATAHVHFSGQDAAPSRLQRRSSALQIAVLSENATIPCIPVPPDLSPKKSCAHVRAHCTGDDDRVLARYLTWYYCADADEDHSKKPSSTHVRSQRTLRLLLLLAWLAFLFSFVGIVASDFFCPNLSTLAARLGMSDSTAGVTLLSIGNSSPDVFGTYSAMRSDSGALAIGELIGAASFISSVVAGSVVLISQFEVRRWPFVRDVGFFAIAVAVVLFCLIDGVLHLGEALAMIGLYVLYAAIVIVGSWIEARKDPPPSTPQGDEVSSYAVHEHHARPSLRVRIPSVSHHGSEGGGSVEVSAPPSTAATPMDPAHHLRAGYLPRHSILGAIEFRDVLQNLRKETGSDRSVELFQSRDPESFLKPMNSSSMMRRSISRSPGTTPQLSASVQAGSAPLLRSASTSASKDARAAGQHLTAAPRRDYFDATQTASSSSSLDALEGHWAEQYQSRSAPFVSTATPAAAQPLNSTPHKLPSRSKVGSEVLGILRTLFPSMQNVWAKSWLGIFVSFATAPAILCLNLTLPVVDDELEAKIAAIETDMAAIPGSIGLPGDERQLLAQSADAAGASIGDDPTLVNSRPAETVPQSEMPGEALIQLSKARKLLTVVQCTLAPPFCVWAISEPDNDKLWLHLLASLAAGASVGIGALVVIWHTRKHRPPQVVSTTGALLRCVLGFIVSVMWIMTIADQVVVIFQALGSIAGVSEAILGLTVFAAGNSLADFVANTTMAPIHPVMAISACFAGPLLNLLLGIGLSGTAILSKSDTAGYRIEFSATLLISGIGILILLVGLLGVVIADNFHLSRRTGVWLILGYLGIMTANLIAVLTGIERAT